MISSDCDHVLNLAQNPVQTTLTTLSEITGSVVHNIDRLVQFIPLYLLYSTGYCSSILARNEAQRTLTVHTSKVNDAF